MSTTNKQRHAKKEGIFTFVHNAVVITLYIASVFISCLILFVSSLSDKFDIAAFNKLRLIFRKRNRPLRQPILLTDYETLVSMSLADGIFHPPFHNKTLGIDTPNNQRPFLYQISNLRR